MRIRVPIADDSSCGTRRDARCDSRRVTRYNSRRGVVLIVVLLVVALLSLSAYTFSDLMLVEHAAAKTHADMAKTREAALSGAALARAFLLVDPQTRNESGGIYDNPELFRGQIIHADDDPAFQTMCAITSPAYDSNGTPVGIRNGLENESGRLNLNWLLNLSASTTTPAVPGVPAASPAASSTASAARSALMGLPGMTLEIADAILDWIDADDEPRDYGAEMDYYTSLDRPYQPRNGPLNSIDELLMVRGVMPDLLFGRDQNRSGRLEESEVTLQMVSEVDESNGASMDLGWASMLTAHSSESPPLNPNGEPKLALNDVDDVQTLVDELAGYVSQELAMFVGAYIAYEPDDSPNPGVPIAGAVLTFSGSGDTGMASVVDLIDAKVNANGTIYASPLQSQSLSTDIDVLQDYATTDTVDEVILGRVNINEATYAVLMAVPGMTENVVQTIVNQRDPTLDPLTSPRRHPTWLLTEGLIEIDAMREMIEYITTGGDVYRAQVVGYFGDGTGVSRADIILDATEPDIPLLLWKDKTDLGSGFSKVELVGDASGEEQ